MAEHDATSPAELADGQARELERLRRVARIMDASIPVPGTRFRIGLDPILGLIPGVGDAATAAVSVWLVLRAKRLGARRRTLWRMGGNVALDLLVGSVPIVGDLFDAGFRANRKNIRLLERDLGR